MNRSAATTGSVQATIAATAMHNCWHTLRCNIHCSLPCLPCTSPEELPFEKRGSFLTLWVSEERRRRRMFGKPTMVQKEDLVGEPTGLSQVMRSHDNLGARVMKTVEQGFHG